MMADNKLNATVFSWNIDNFLSLGINRLTSPDFAIPGNPLIKWNVTCDPYGGRKKGKRFVSVFLNKCTDDCEVELEYLLLVVGAGVQHKARTTVVFDKERKGWGWVQFLSREQIVDDGFLVDGSTLTIQVKVLVVGHTVYLDEYLNYYLNWDTSDLNKIKHCDVRLKAEGRTFEAHKFILSGHSDYFEKMFDSEFSEQVNNEVDLTKFGADVIEEVLRFIYTGQLQDFDALSEHLIFAADYFQLDMLKALCQDNLAFRISLDNCLKFLAIADRANAADLKKTAMLFVLKNKTNIDKCWWKSFVRENNDLAVELIFGQDL